MQYWLDQGWNGHRIRRWYSLRKIERDEKGNAMRSTRTGPVKPQDKMVTRNLESAVIEERKLYRNVCCSCPEYADHRLGCPIRRPSRSPNFKGHRGFGLMVMVGVTVPTPMQRHMRSS
eukprot:2541400-Pyramimonas_sp.AAC.1